MTTRLHGTAGTAEQLPGNPRWPATVAGWFLHCPGQSPAWAHYLLVVVHLRPADNVPAPIIRVAGATHELLVVALDPARQPRPDDVNTWRHLYPVNVAEQVTLPDDTAAQRLAHTAAAELVAGHLWAEPPLAGQTEPWHSIIQASAAHLSGEHQ